MKTTKEPYKAPEVERLRVFLEKSVAANASAQLVGPADTGITQRSWEDTSISTSPENDIVLVL